MLTKLLSLFLSFLMIYMSAVSAYAQHGVYLKSATPTYMPEPKTPEMKALDEYIAKLNTPSSLEEEIDEAVDVLTGGQCLGEKKMHALFAQVYMEQIQKEYKANLAILDSGLKALEQAYGSIPHSEKTAQLVAEYEKDKKEFTDAKLKLDVWQHLQTREDGIRAAYKDNRKDFIKKVCETSLTASDEEIAQTQAWLKGLAKRLYDDILHGSNEAFKPEWQRMQEKQGNEQGMMSYSQYQQMRQLDEKERGALMSKASRETRLMERSFPIFWAVGGLEERERAAVASMLRLTINEHHKACNSSKENNECQRVLKAAEQLLIVGKGEADRGAFENLFNSGRSGAYAAAVIITAGAGLVETGGEVPLRRALYTEIKRELDAHGLGWDMVDLFSPLWGFEKKVEVLHVLTAEEYWDDIKRPESFYQSDVKINGHAALGNAWMDLGEYMGLRASEGNQMARNLLNLLADSMLQASNGGFSIKFPLFTTGVLISGFKFADTVFQGREYDATTNRSEKAVHVDTRAGWKRMRGYIKQSGLDNEGYLLLLTYRHGKLELDPYTKGYVQKKIADAYKSTGRPNFEGLRIGKANYPTQREIAAYDAYQNNLKAARGIDIIALVIGVFGLISLFRGARSVKQVARFVQLARAGQAASKGTKGLFEMYRRVVHLARLQRANGYGRRLMMINDLAFGGKIKPIKGMKPKPALTKLVPEAGKKGGPKNLNDWSAGKIKKYQERKPTGFKTETPKATAERPASKESFSERGLKNTEGSLDRGVYESDAEKWLADGEKARAKQAEIKAAEQAAWEKEQAARGAKDAQRFGAEAEEARTVKSGQQTGQAVSTKGAKPAGQTVIPLQSQPLSQPSRWNAFQSAVKETLWKGWYIAEEVGSGLKMYFGPKPSTVKLSLPQRVWGGVKKFAIGGSVVFTNLFGTLNAEMLAARDLAAGANSSKIIQMADVANTSRSVGKTISWAELTRDLSLTRMGDAASGLRSGSAVGELTSQTAQLGNIARMSNGLKAVKAGINPFGWMKLFAPSLVLGAFWDPERMKNSSIFSTPSSLQTTGAWAQYQTQVHDYNARLSYDQIRASASTQTQLNQYQDWQRRLLGYQTGNATIQLDYERQGYPITAQIQSELQNVRDYFYLKYAAPWTLRNNPFYQARINAPVVPVAAEETGEQTAQEAAEETAPASQEGQEAGLADMFASSAFASQLWALLVAGNTSTDPNQSPKKRNNMLNRFLQAKYTKILKEVQPLAKQRAIFEFLAMETDIIDSFVEDQAFLAVYHSELKKAILATKLPDAVKKLALQTVEERMMAAAEAVKENPALAAKHTVMAIPLYHHNRIIDYWLVEPPTGFKLKENQEVYAVIGEEKGKADLFESTYTEDDRRDKIESTRLRADIPITKEGRVFATTGFGLRKVAEGLSLMINHLWPMYLIYVLAGLGNVSSTIATFAKASFTLSQQEMYIFGGVTSVVMGLSSFVVGLLQERLSRNPDGSINSSRGRLISMNIGMALCLLAFVLPMLGGIAGNMGPATEVKKQLLIASFIALGIGAAFIDVAMKPTLLSVTKKGDYQAKQGYLSVFKQVVGNMSNYVIPPIAIGLGSLMGQAWDWSVYFPIYSAVTMAILALYNAFKMHSQTLEETEFVPEKTNLWQDVKKIGTEFFGSQKYNQLFRHGVAKTIAHGANMSILGLYVNNLFKDHYPADEHTWLIHSLIMFTLPIIVGRIFGTAVMKHDLKIGNKTIIKKQNLGSMLKLSSAAILLALAAIASGVWTLQMAGVVLAALGLTNISPIVGGYTADHTRKISNTVSAMLSATSVVTFGLAALFGTLLEWSGSPWVSFLLPAVLLSGIFLFGMEISSHRLEGEGTPEVSGLNWLRIQMQRLFDSPKPNGNAENPTDDVDINNEGQNDGIDFDGGESPAY